MGRRDEHGDAGGREGEESRKHEFAHRPSQLTMAGRSLGVVSRPLQACVEWESGDL